MLTILIDLDGTITDPAPGIIGAVQHALEHLGRSRPDFDSLRWVIGPPLRQAFPKLLPPGCDVEEAVRLYREHYGRGGLYKATLYPGIEAELTRLKACPAQLFVCTAKPTVFARPILEHFGIAPLLDGIYGAELDGRFDDKGELIGHILAVERIDPARVVMIGDRANDVLAAARHAIPSIGVTWGYGGVDELTQAGATALCSSPDRLTATVRELTGSCAG